MKKLTLLVGPPGSGKTSLTGGYAAQNYMDVSQDRQGKKHLEIFQYAIDHGYDVCVDRMNYNKAQRARYLVPAIGRGYETEIVVLHENYDTCLQRCLDRKDHETIKDETSAKAALQHFFTKYERVEDGEADVVRRVWPEGAKPKACIIDLDGTLANCDHRLHHVKNGNKNWKAFFAGIPQDTPNYWCVDILEAMAPNYTIVYCSGRSEEHRDITRNWMEDHGNLDLINIAYNKFSDARCHLYMRPNNDSRKDSIVKEILLDFEILTRFEPYFMIDDRQQVVDMYRSRGYTVLQCAKGDF